jgi:peroxiredoxin
MQESVLDLSRSGILDRSVKRGELAPDFSLPNSLGTSIQLTDLLTRGPVVPSFYRGNWCPFCSIELQALQNALPRVTELGATLVAVSPQTTPCSEGADEDCAPGYEVLSDNGNKVARSRGRTESCSTSRTRCRPSTRNSVSSFRNTTATTRSIYQFQKPL